MAPPSRTRERPPLGPPLGAPPRAPPRAPQRGKGPTDEDHRLPAGLNTCSPLGKDTGPSRPPAGEEEQGAVRGRSKERGEERRGQEKRGEDFRGDEKGEGSSREERNKKGQIKNKNRKNKRHR